MVVKTTVEGRASTSLEQPHGLAGASDVTGEVFICTNHFVFLFKKNSSLVIHV